jgi:hypothetical protein
MPSSATWTLQLRSSAWADCDQERSEVTPSYQTCAIWRLYYPCAAEKQAAVGFEVHSCIAPLSAPKKVIITQIIAVGSLGLNALRHINIYGLPGGPMDAFAHFLVVVTAASTFYYFYLFYVGEAHLGPPGDED